MARRDDQPGAVWFYNPVGGQKPEWERPPQIPLNELGTILDKALEHMRALAADVDVQPDPRLTTGTASAAIDEANSAAPKMLAHHKAARLSAKRIILCQSLPNRPEKFGPWREGAQSAPHAYSRPSALKLAWRPRPITR